MLSVAVLVNLFIWLVVLGIVFGLVKWALSALALDPPFDKWANVVLVVITVLILIGLLLSLVGLPSGISLR